VCVCVCVCWKEALGQDSGGLGIGGALILQSDEF
jgi:hypothetical protein